MFPIWSTTALNGDEDFQNNKNVDICKSIEILENKLLRSHLAYP